MPTEGFWRYWRRFVVRLWRDGFKWFWDNIFCGIIVLVVPPAVLYFLHLGKQDWQTVRIALYCYGAMFVLYGVVHWLRTPWKLDVDRQKELVAKDEALGQAQKETEALRWPADHPFIRFLSWSQSPHDYRQHGFTLQNHGGMCAEIRVNDFKVGPKIWTAEIIPGLDKSKTSFVPVWQLDGNQFDKFELVPPMVREAKNGPSFSVPISLVYRDIENNWYTGTAALRWVQGTVGLEFGPTTCKKIKPPSP